MKRILYVILILTVSLVVPAVAEDTPASPPAPAAKAQPKADTPKEIYSRKTPLYIAHTGTDILGTNLVFELTNTCNSSSLFALKTDKEQNISVLITTHTEFPSRPEIGSVYSVVWVYSEDANNLKYFLAQDAGIVTKATAQALARSIASKTDQIAMQYEYLFD